MTQGIPKYQVFSAEERDQLLHTPCQTPDDVMLKLAASIELVVELVDRQAARIDNLGAVVDVQASQLAMLFDLIKQQPTQ